jgi:hypothetical protein
MQLGKKTHMVNRILEWNPFFTNNGERLLGDQEEGCMAINTMTKASPFEYGNTTKSINRMGQIFGILVLLHVCFCDAALRSVLKPFEDMERSKAYLLRWMHEIQVVHPVVRWCWQLLKIIYTRTIRSYERNCKDRIRNL